MELNDVRFLRSGNALRTDTGPIMILAVVCVLFCLIWTPVICHRRFPFLRHCVWGFNQEEQDADRQAEIIRVSLENIHRLGLDYPGLQTGGIVRSARRLSAIQAMRPDDRREYINNLLVSRKILKIVSESPPTDDGGDWDDGTIKSCSVPSRKTSLLLADLVSVDSTTKLVSVEPCPICLNEYVEGEILCWSQNTQCKHCFHKDCAVEWLMNHEECPLCRYNYLSLDGEDPLDSIQEPTEPELGPLTVTLPSTR